MSDDYFDLYQAAKRRVFALEAQAQALREALDKLARLGNEPHLGNSMGNVIAQEALAATEPK